MAWRIEFAQAADRELGKLDPQIARRILEVLHDRIAEAEDPRAFGEVLKGSELGEFWKYRIGDYRLDCSIEDQALRILVLRIGHRSEVYR